MPETPFDYSTYLQSDRWQELRRLALDVADHRCQVCNQAQNLEVHHRTYERLHHEQLNDVTVLCNRCHALFHGVVPSVPATEIGSDGGLEDLHLLLPPRRAGEWGDDLDKH